MKLLLIDNYDSFTYNLVHYVQELGAEVEVARNDQITVAAALSGGHDGIIISPGPATPDDSGICLELVKQGANKKPMLGVCLGHQAIGQAFGGKVIRADKPMHGKTSEISHQGDGVFKGLPSPCVFTRYHSLIVERKSLPDCFEITAEAPPSDSRSSSSPSLGGRLRGGRLEDGIIMGIQHKRYPIHGVQFHPESIASEHGHDLLRNFLELI